MGHGATRNFPVTFVSGATITTTAIDLGSAWSHMILQIPARSNTTIYVHVSGDNSTFKKIYNAASRAGVESIFQIASGTTNVALPIPAGYRYMKLETEDAISNGATFNIICSDLGSRNG